MRNSHQQPEMFKIAVNAIGRDMTHFQLAQEPAPASKRKLPDGKRGAESRSTAALRPYSCDQGAAWFESMMADFESAELEPAG
jgi:hypothetical protein